MPHITEKYINARDAADAKKRRATECGTEDFIAFQSSSTAAKGFPGLSGRFLCKLCLSNGQMGGRVKIAIVDDETSEREILVRYIGEWAAAKKELVEFRCFDGSESFLFSWEDDKDYRLLVLDIEMGGMSGLELAKKIRLEDKELPIIFVTGYDEYMQYGYDVSALHYLIKPVNKERLFQALNKLSEKGETAKNLILNSENEIRRISVSQIFYVEAAGHGSVLHTADEVIRLKESFGSIERQVLSTGEAVKCHRAYLVNLRFVSAIRNTNLILDNGESLPISRSRMKNVQQEFLRYYKSRQG